MHRWHSKIVWAAEKCNWVLVKEFIDAGHDVEKKGHCGSTALGMACAGGHLETIRRLVEEKGADLEARDDHGKTALVWASACGKLQAVRYLVAKGARFDREGADSRWKTVR